MYRLAKFLLIYMYILFWVVSKSSKKTHTKCILLSTFIHVQNDSNTRKRKFYAFVTIQKFQENFWSSKKNTFKVKWMLRLFLAADEMTNHSVSLSDNCNDCHVTTKQLPDNCLKKDQRQPDDWTMTAWQLSTNFYMCKTSATPEKENFTPLPPFKSSRRTFEALRKTLLK